MNKPISPQARTSAIVHGLLGLLLAHALAGCGSGGNQPVSAGIPAALPAPPSFPAPPSSPAVGIHGHFVGTVTIDGQDYFGDALFTTDGEVRLYVGGLYSASGALQTSPARRSVQFIGNFTLLGNGATGSGAIIGQGCAAPQLTRFCDETVSGEVSFALDADGLGLYGEIQVTTNTGVETWSLDLWPWNYYQYPARLEELAGQYTEQLAEFASAGDVVMRIDQVGQLFFQSAGSGCTGNGTMTPHLSGEFSVYDVTLSIGNCKAPYAHLNGDYQGLATTTPSDYWNYDTLLRAWLSKPDGAPSPAAMTLLASPI